MIHISLVPDREHLRSGMGSKEKGLQRAFVYANTGMRHVTIAM